MRHAPLWLLLALSVAAGAAGCADPNPTFVFDAAPVSRGAGGADGSAVETGAPEPGDDDGGTDGGADAAGDAR